MDQFRSFNQLGHKISQPEKLELRLFLNIENSDLQIMHGHETSVDMDGHE